MNHERCSLEPDALRARLREWGAVVGTDLLRLGSRDSFSSTRVIEVPNSPGRREEVQRLVELERDCCPHLHFDLTETDERIILSIEES